MKIAKQLCLTGLVALGLAIGVISIVNAVTYDVGYFSQLPETKIGYGPVLSSSLPYSTDKEAFISAIMDNLNSSTGNPYNDPRNRTGAAFIIQTMLGGSNHNRPSQLEIDDWKARIRNPAVTIVIDWAYSHYYTSGYTGDTNNGASGHDDDAYYSWNNVKPALTFNVGGVEKAAILIDCGNPFDEIGLPPPLGWSITPTVTIDKTTANPGDTVTWTHTITNDGPTSTDKVVNYYYQDSDASGNLSGSKVSAGNLPLLSISGATSSSTSTSSAPSSGTICRVTIAIPKSSTSAITDPIQSAPACVTVGTPTAGVCRPWVLAVDVPTDVHDHTPVPVHITGTDVTDPSVPAKHWTTTKSLFDITHDCTNGDMWTFHFVTDSYVWYHRTYCTGDYCVPFDHDSYRTDTWDASAQGPCFDYNLTAGIKPPLGVYQVEVGTKVLNITPTLTSKSWTQINLPSFYNTVVDGVPYNTHTRTKTTDWQISQKIIAPNTPVPTLKNPSPNNPGASNPQTYFGAAGWTSIRTGTAVFKADGTFKSGTNPLVPFTMPIGDLPSGTKVCFAFSVHAAASDPGYHLTTLDNTWNHSALNTNGYSINTTTAIQPCIIVVKKPKVQVWGGDLSVGKTYVSSAGANANVSTTTSLKTTGVFGSWVEYGIFATGLINGMASGSAFAGPQGLNITDVTTGVCNFSKLSFANTKTLTCSTSSTDKGHYNSNLPIPAVVASFTGKGSPISGTVEPNALPKNSPNSIVDIYSAGNLTLKASTLAPGRSIIIKATGTVTIIGNQTYSPNNNGVNYTGISQLPQLVIIANNISINDNAINKVTRIDAWLIASGTINTCIDGGDNGTHISANDCSDSLTVNGPVMAQRLYLRRTAGSGTVAASGDAAETFNLRADTYLWAYARSTSSGRVQTVYTTELPPRL